MTRINGHHSACSVRCGHSAVAFVTSARIRHLLSTAPTLKFNYFQNKIQKQNSKVKNTCAIVADDSSDWTDGSIGNCGVSARSDAAATLSPCSSCCCCCSAGTCGETLDIAATCCCWRSPAAVVAPSASAGFASTSCTCGSSGGEMGRGCTVTEGELNRGTVFEKKRVGKQHAHHCNFKKINTHTHERALDCLMIGI